MAWYLDTGTTLPFTFLNFLHYVRVLFECPEFVWSDRVKRRNRQSGQPIPATTHAAGVLTTCQQRSVRSMELYIHTAFIFLDGETIGKGDELLDVSYHKLLGRVDSLHVARRRNSAVHIYITQNQTFATYYLTRQTTLSFHLEV
jgi:hypothetical protein